MSRFRKLAQTIWHCQYHIVWVPKYRFKILTGKVEKMVENCVRAFSEQQSCEVLELNVQIDHVHIVVMVPPQGVDIGLCGYCQRENGNSCS